MFKITGAILLLAGTMGAGMSMYLDKRRRLYHIRYMQRIFTLLAGEIAYAKSTMEEACLAVSAKVESPYRELLEKIYAGLTDGNGYSFTDVWSRAVSEHLTSLPLKKTELAMVEKFADYTGYMDIELQKRFIMYETEDLEKLAVQAEEELTRQGKLYITFGVMSGLFLIIILL